MKLLIIFATLLFTQLVFAQAQTNTQSKKKAAVVKKNAAKKTKATKQQKINAQAIVTNQKASDKIKVPAETVAAAKTAPKVEERNWYITLVSENAKPITKDNPNNYGGDIVAYQMAAFGYRFTNEVFGQIAQEWTHYYGYGTAIARNNSAGEDNIADTTMEDLSLRLTKVNLLKANGIVWALQGRYYLPTSETSQLVRQMGQIRLNIIGEAAINKQWTASLLVSPRYYLQRDKSYTDTYGIIGGEGTEGKEYNSNDWRLYASTGLKYNVTDNFALETTVGIYSKKRHNESMKHFQDYSTSFYYVLNKFFTFNFGIRASDGALDVSKEGYELYNHRVSEYYAIITLNLK